MNPVDEQDIKPLALDKLNVSPLKLHLGCGSKHIPGYLHCDLLDHPHVDFKVSVADLNFIQDNTVDLIYACHVLEHFGRHEYLAVLKEWFRVLKPGAVLRLAVPDFESVVAYYNTSYNQDTNLNKILGLVVGGQKVGQYDYHNMIFDFKSIKDALIGLGFSHVNRYNWRETEHANVDDFSQCYLPHMDKENGRLMSLNIEAIK